MVFTLSKKEPPFTRITEPEAYKQLGGKDIDKLLIKADKQREVLWKEGLIDTYSVHAIYNAETGDWRGQLYNYRAFTS
jgi:hypothetical protein